MRADSRQPPKRGRRHSLAWLLASAIAALGAGDAFAGARSKHVTSHRTKALKAERHKRGAEPARSATSTTTPSPAARGPGATAQTAGLRNAATRGARGRSAARHHKRDRAAREVARGIPVPIPRPADTAPAETAPAPAAAVPPEVTATKQAIELVRRGKPSDATALAASIGDPVAQKLVEWALLRHSDSGAGFQRYAAFIRDNPDWPGIRRLRRRAEARLWQERRDAATVRGFLGDGPPTTAVGRLALARVLAAEGDRAGTEREVRAAWGSPNLSSEVEAAVLDTHRDILTRADHRARMDRLIGAKDLGAAMRAAKRLGDADAAIVKACGAAQANASNAEKLLNAVPESARQDLGYVLCRFHWLLRREDLAAAVKLVLGASPEDLARQDTDEWWRKRRMLARKLIDQGDAKIAYQVVREAAPPDNPYYRADFHFMPGWIALRFLGDPETAREHFAHIDEGATDPIVRSRASYWRGRAAEAAGQLAEMRANYEAAAAYPTAYYGQLARARLGPGETALRQPSTEPLEGIARDLVHAGELLYAIGARELAMAFLIDLADESDNTAALAALGELTARYNDAQTMMLMGKTALARGLAMDRYAFPDIGVPAYNPIAPHVDRCVIYSIVRTESAFDQHDKSPANAVGLMQITPEAGRDTAKRFGVAYDWKKLVSDPVYNIQMGAGEISALLKEYRGSFIMTFAGYNAGRGRVQQWMAQHGDPRDPKVDAVDWVERIPFSETRNYVQRVMENLQVYRARFGSEMVTIEPNLHRATTVESRAHPEAAAQPVSQ